MAGTLRRLFPVWLAVLVGAAPAAACPFCSMQGKTLTGEVADASMVLYGTLKNAKLAGGDGQGTTDLHIDAVIKDHEILAGRKVLTIDRYIPEDGKYKYLIFCDVFKGKIDPYHGRAVKADSGADKYLLGALKVADKKPGERLRFFFDYLDHDEVEVSNDAYKEFANADYKDYQDMAKGLPADKIAKWLQDPKTPGFRHGLYASMLGHCGKDKDAELLRSLLDDPDKRVTSGVDGVLAGYLMLKPKEGWDYTVKLLKDSKKEFSLRYAALRTLRFFYESRSDVVGKNQVAEGASYLLDQGDIADLAIEDLRKWGRWEMTARVLGYYKNGAHDVPIIRRAILRFALSCPADNKLAAEFVAQRRMEDPKAVGDAEELLKLEGAATPPSK